MAKLDNYKRCSFWRSKKNSSFVLTLGKFLDALGSKIGTGLVFCLSLSVIYMYCYLKKNLVWFLDCNVSIDDKYGQIRSYGFPNEYYNYLDCTWLIQSSPLEAIEVTFNHFDVESSIIFSTCS